MRVHFKRYILLSVIILMSFSNINAFYWGVNYSVPENLGFRFWWFETIGSEFGYSVRHRNITEDLNVETGLDVKPLIVKYFMNDYWDLNCSLEYSQYLYVLYENEKRAIMFNSYSLKLHFMESEIKIPINLTDYFEQVNIDLKLLVDIEVSVDWWYNKNGEINGPFSSLYVPIGILVYFR